MTREEARKTAEIITAYADGKQIQYRPTAKGKWEDINDPAFQDGDITKYRVKPELKVVPFTFEDVEKFMGKPLKHKEFKNTFCMIQEVNESNVWIGVGSEPRPYKFLLDNYTFLDGSLCGKTVEE